MTDTCDPDPEAAAGEPVDDGWDGQTIDLGSPSVAVAEGGDNDGVLAPGAQPGQPQV